MLTRLKSIHEELLSAIAALEELLGDVRPDPENLEQVRRNLSRVSTLRTRLLEDDIYPFVLAAGDVKDAAAIKALQADAARFRPISATHVALWTSDRIVRTWPKYASASASMRESMRRRVRREQEALYPMLDMRERGRGPA